MKKNYVILKRLIDLGLVNVKDFYVVTVYEGEILLQGAYRHMGAYQKWIHGAESIEPNGNSILTVKRRVGRTMVELIFSQCDVK